MNWCRLTPKRHLVFQFPTTDQFLLISVQLFRSQLLQPHSRKSLASEFANRQKIFDSIHNLGYTTIINTHHEQAAVMAMGAHFRASGELSVAIVTAGGGSSNAITGVVSNWADSIPGFIISGTHAASGALHGSVVLNLESSSAFTWAAIGATARSDGNLNANAGSKSLSAELTQLKIVAVNGTDAFDAGEINIAYE